MGDRLDRRSRAPRPRSWRAATLGVALWAASGAAAFAFGPSDVLDSTPASERTQRQAAALAQAERVSLRSDAGTSARLRARPSLSYGADVEDPAELGAAATVTLELGWLDDRAAALKDRAELLAARQEALRARRRDLLDALRLHGRLLVAEVALRRAELDLAGRQPGSAGAARGRALRDRRRHQLEALRAEARALGFDGKARFESIRFALPEAPGADPDVERLRLALEAALRERDAIAFDPFPEVTLDALYESRSHGYQVAASLGLDHGRPAAGLEGELGPQEDDQWRVALSARIVVDGTADEAHSAADERVRRARAALELASTDYGARVRRARAAVDDARAILEAELALWREADPASADTVRACRALLSRENATYGAWLDLVSATYGYLEVVDGTWAAAPGGSSEPLPDPYPQRCAVLGA